MVDFLARGLAILVLMSSEQLSVFVLMAPSIEDTLNNLNNHWFCGKAGETSYRFQNYYVMNSNTDGVTLAEYK